MYARGSGSIATPQHVSSRSVRGRWFECDHFPSCMTQTPSSMERPPLANIRLLARSLNPYLWRTGLINHTKRSSCHDAGLGRRLKCGHIAPNPRRKVYYILVTSEEGVCDQRRERGGNVGLRTSESFRPSITTLRNLVSTLDHRSE